MDALVPRRARATPAAYAVVCLGLIVAAIVAVFAFQAAGYAPCELCLKERLPYYAGVALAASTILATLRGATPVSRLCFGLLAALFLSSAGFGAYHAGVEWGFWPGPTDCTGTLAHATSNADFLRQLDTVRVVRCDAVAIRILGLSLAGWNAIASLAIVSVALAGFVARGSTRAEPRQGSGQARGQAQGRGNVSMR